MVSGLVVLLLLRVEWACDGCGSWCYKPMIYMSLLLCSLRGAVYRQVMRHPFTGLMKSMCADA